MQAGNVDDVIELWNGPPPTPSKVVPESSEVVNICPEIDWSRVRYRSRSEDNLFCRRSAKFKVRGVDISWPLAELEIDPLRMR